MYIVSSQFQDYSFNFEVTNMSSEKTIQIENNYFAPFYNRLPISFEYANGSLAYDEEGKEYIDMTSGWGTTPLGHSHKNVISAINDQANRIIQNPCISLTYSPVRAELLEILQPILPEGLTRLFFSNSGAEANDAAIKLARKITGRLDIISTEKSFHGRTTSTISATGQLTHRNKFNPLLSNYVFVPFNQAEAIKKVINKNVAAIILEPIQGEGGINMPDEGYLSEVSQICEENGSLLILDEIQTGYGRVGKMFFSKGMGLKIDFLTMAKGLANGYPISFFAMTEEVACKLEIGDHGGTFCNNPLGCAAALATTKTLIEEKIPERVDKLGKELLQRLDSLQNEFPHVIKETRGKGFLIAIQFQSGEVRDKIYQEITKSGLLTLYTQKDILRIMPVLNIKDEILWKGINILRDVIAKI